MLRNELRDGIGEEFTARNAKAMRERLRRFEKGVRKRDSGLHAASITKVIPLFKSAERELVRPTKVALHNLFAPLAATLRISAPSASCWGSMHGLHRVRNRRAIQRMTRHADDSSEPAVAVAYGVDGVSGAADVR